MIEIDTTFEVADGYIARGRINIHNPNAPIIVFAHGLGGKPWEQPERRETSDNFEDGFSDLAVAFSSHECNTVRFQFYETKPSKRPKARTWRDVDPHTYRDDLDAVVSSVKAQYPNTPIIAVGHSYGGLAVLLSQKQEFDAGIMYDPTFVGPERFKEDNWELNENDQLFYNKTETNWYYTHNQMEITRNVDKSQLIANFKKPYFVLIAGQGWDTEHKVELFSKGPQCRDIVILQDANHSFTNHRAMVVKQTLDWIHKLDS